MKVYQHLFFLNKDMVTVAEYNNSEKEFSYIRNKGEEEFPVTEDFWQWWKEAVSYISGEITDFCFIYDKEYNILSDGFIKNTQASGESCWTESRVIQFLTKIPEYGNIILTDCNGKTFPSENKAITGKNNETFYTNIEYKGRDRINTVPVKEGNGNISPLAEYYRGIMVSENK